MKLKSLVACGLALISMIANVRALDIQVAGTTTGIFTETSSNTWKNLTFTGNSFDVFTFDGASGLSVPDHLGTIAIAPVGSNYGIEDAEVEFVLSITFSIPNPTNPGTVLVPTQISGKVSAVAGQVRFDFTNDRNNPSVVSFDGGLHKFEIYVDDITINQGGAPVTLTGGIQSVPDGGATAALLGCSFLGLAYVRNRFALLKA